MAFSNRIRLPFYISKPQYPVDEEIYLKANGKRVVLRAIISKELIGKTDWMPQQWHERLNIALRHDTVNIENTKFNAGLRISGAYDIDWQDFLDYPLAPAIFKAFEEEFAARNNRCDTCEEFEQLTVNDDTIFGTLTCGATYVFDPTENDAFCCTNAIFSIVSYNATYIDTISIDSATGVVTFTLKSGYNDVITANLFVYQVQCGTETKTGTVEARISCEGGLTCEAPQNLELIATQHIGGTYNILASWDAPAGGAPACGYHWQLTRINNDMTETLIASGSTTGTTAAIGNKPIAHYRFLIGSDCCDGDLSPNIFQDIQPNTGGGGNLHLNVGEYEALAGDVSGVCTMINGSITRTPEAVADATAANQCTRIHVRWRADTGCNVFASYDFQPTDSSITGITVPLDCLGACGEIFVDIISVVLISC